jgi:hypothetical protein
MLVTLSLTKFFSVFFSRRVLIHIPAWGCRTYGHSSNALFGRGGAEIFGVYDCNLCDFIAVLSNSV